MAIGGPEDKCLGCGQSLHGIDVNTHVCCICDRGEGYTGCRPPCARYEGISGAACGCETRKGRKFPCQYHEGWNDAIEAVRLAAAGLVR